MNGGAAAENSANPTEAERLSAAREKVARILKKSAPHFALGEGPLNELAKWLKDAPWPGWENVEAGFPAARARRERLERAATALLAALDEDGAGESPGLGTAILEARKPVRALAQLAAHERENLPPPEPRAWKVYAEIFYELAIQCWIEGGAGFFRGSVPQFGIGEGGKATKAVKALLEVAGKKVTSAALAKTLASRPAPAAWLMNAGDGPTRDFDQWCAGVWDFDEKGRRKLLKKSEAFQNNPAPEPKKNRGRPRKTWR
ncbi:hypothetical protein [Acidocella facilis]|uniref:hypothetical protein n=1 Tax=Acidocella facilis TaxID=525 RepID=UPI001F1AAA3E|nr:hypothetical protein [Acidocella facilis]